MSEKEIAVSVPLDAFVKICKSLRIRPKKVKDGSYFARKKLDEISLLFECEYLKSNDERKQIDLNFTPAGMMMKRQARMMKIGLTDTVLEQDAHIDDIALKDMLDRNWMVPVAFDKIGYQTTMEGKRKLDEWIEDYDILGGES